MPRFAILFICCAAFCAGCSHRTAASGDASPPEPGCPATAPADGERCAEPGLTCHFGCDSMRNTCDCGGGSWSCYHSEWCLEPPPPQPDAAVPPTPDATTAAPVQVIIENAGASPLYIDGLSAPFAVRDAAGTRRHPEVPFGSFACARCAEQCSDNPMHGDPAPCYVEIPAGAAVTLTWDGELHEGDGQCTECTKQCHQSKGRIPAGEHVFEVPFRAALDDAYTYHEANCAYPPIQGAPQWQGDGIGVPQFDQQAELQVSFDGGAEIRLRLGE